MRSISQATNKVFKMRAHFFIGSRIFHIVTAIRTAVEPSDEYSELFLRD
jgi:hypothetical protein